MWCWFNGVKVCERDEELRKKEDIAKEEAKEAEAQIKDRKAEGQMVRWGEAVKERHSVHGKTYRWMSCQY